MLAKSGKATRSEAARPPVSSRRRALAAAERAGMARGAEPAGQRRRCGQCAAEAPPGRGAGAGDRTGPDRTGAGVCAALPAGGGLHSSPVRGVSQGPLRPESSAGFPHGSGQCLVRAEKRWMCPSLLENQMFLVCRLGSVVACFTSAKFLLYLGHALSTWVSKVLAG